MEATAILSIVEGGLRLLAEVAPAIYRAIVPDGRTVDEVIADARAAVEAIPERPAGRAIDAHRARLEEARRAEREDEPTREHPIPGKPTR
jgi:ribosomal protein L12E/L44/L45/RPP1/RPP2